MSSRQIIAWLWTSFIFVACWTPKRLIPEEEHSRQTLLIPNFDKLVHFSLFFGFALLWMGTRSIRVRWVLAAGLLATALSELGQLVPAINRDANLADGTADMLGVGAGLLVYELAQVVLRRARRSTLGSEPDRG